MSSSQRKSKSYGLEGVGGGLIDLKNLYDKLNENDSDNEINKPIQNMGLSTKSLGANYSSHDPSMSTKESKKTTMANPNMKNTGLNGVGFAASQRPANRNDIIALGNELEEKLKSKAAKLYMKGQLDFLYDDNRKDNGWRKHLLNAFGINYACANTTANMVELLTVNSADMGNLLRKIKKLESQSSDEIVVGVNLLFEVLMATERQLNDTEDKLADQIEKMKTLEVDVLSRCHKRISDLEASRLDAMLNEDERKKQHAQEILELNQKIADLNIALDDKNYQFLEALKGKDASITSFNHLAKSYTDLENEVISKLDEISSLKQSMEKREEILSDLMEKEALRNAEIKKLANLAQLEPDNSADLSLSKTNMSLFCVRCRTQLEDISSVEDAVFGRGARTANRLYCESFRLLLSLEAAPVPVVRKQPEWLRAVMRKILEDRMKKGSAIKSLTKILTNNINTSSASTQQSNTTAVGGNPTTTTTANINNISADTAYVSVATNVFSQCSGRFYHHVFNFFDKEIAFTSLPSAVANVLFNYGDSSDYGESNTGSWQPTDRLSFYTGVRGLVMEGDSEAALFWTLMSDCFGQDGTEFVLHCLSVVKTQLPAEHPLQSIDRMMDRHIYISLTSAEKAAAVLLSRASPKQIDEVMITIAAMSTEVEMQLATRRLDSAGSSTRPKSSSGNGSSSRPQSAAISGPQSGAASRKLPTYTGINIFTWLRILLRQFQGDQLQRLGTFQLMLDTIMLTNTAMPSYPQFTALARSLFYNLLQEVEIMEWFIDCCEERNGKKLTADVIFKTAERRGFFLRAFHNAILTTPPPPPTDTPIITSAALTDDALVTQTTQAKTQ